MSFDPSRPFRPAPLPPPVDLNTPEILRRVAQARSELGELKGLSRALPNALLLLSPAVIRESVASSQIENVNTTVENALQMQLFPEAEQRGPDKEVLRYRDALLSGFEQMKRIPLSARTIRSVHDVLLPDQAGGFRRQQNSIADGGSGRVRYTPPEAPDIPDLISQWQTFIDDDEDGLDPLVKCALQHYQFEAIHPFSDGNGRTGRILIVLHLVHARLLELPVLYVSGYINRNRAAYYELLRAVSREEAWEGWVLFMLDALGEQARETRQTAERVLDLFNEMRERMRAEHRKIYSAELVEQLFSYPVLTPVNLSRRLGVHYTTATRYLTELAKAGILTHSTLGKYKLYANHALLDIVRE
jgi:Fic family protein